MADEFSKVDPLTKYLQQETTVKDEEVPNDMNYDNSDLLNYLTVDLNALPAGIFYKVGTKIMIRAAEVVRFKLILQLLTKTLLM